MKVPPQRTAVASVADSQAAVEGSLHSHPQPSPPCPRYPQRRPTATRSHDPVMWAISATATHSRGPQPCGRGATATNSRIPTAMRLCCPPATTHHSHAALAMGAWLWSHSLAPWPPLCRCGRPREPQPRQPCGCGGCFHSHPTATPHNRVAVGRGHAVTVTAVGGCVSTARATPGSLRKPLEF